MKIKKRLTSRLTSGLKVLESHLAARANKRAADINEEQGGRICSFQTVSVHFLLDFVDQIESHHVAKDMELFTFKEDFQSIKKGETCLLTKRVENEPSTTTNKKKKKMLTVWVPYRDETVTVERSILHSKKRNDWTMEDVYIFVIQRNAQLMEDFVPYTEVIRRRFPAVIGSAYRGSYVISSRQAKFSHVVSAITSRYKPEQLNDAYVWLDIFGVVPRAANTFELDYDKEMERLIDHGLDFGVKHFEEVIVVVPSWTKTKVDPFRRSWCLAELYQACSHQKRLVVVQPAADKKTESMRFISDFESIYETIGFLDFRESLCLNGGERRMLTNLVAQRFPSGWEGIVMNFVRGWLVQALEQKIASLKKAGKAFHEEEPEEQVVELLQNLSRVHVAMNQLDLGETKLSEAIEINIRLLGDHHEEVEAMKVQLAKLQDMLDRQKMKPNEFDIFDNGLDQDDGPSNTNMTNSGSMMEDSLSIPTVSTPREGKKSHFEDTIQMEQRMAMEVFDEALILIKNGEKVEAEKKLNWLLNSLTDGNGKVNLSKPNSDLTQLVLEVLETLGELHEELGMYARAIANFEEVLMIQREQVGSIHAQVAETLNKIGRNQANRKEYDLALKTFTKGLAMCKENPGDHPSDSTKLSIMLNIARVFKETGRIKEAQQICQEIYGRPGDEIFAAKALQMLGAIYMNFGDVKSLQTSKEKFIHAIRTLKDISKDPSADPQIAECMLEMAKVHEKLGQSGEAFEQYENAMNILTKSLGREHPKVADTIYEIAEFLLRQKRFEEAFKSFKRAFDLYSSTNHAKSSDALENMSFILEIQGKFDEAYITGKDALESFRDHYGESHPNTQRLEKKLENLARKRNLQLV